MSQMPSKENSMEKESNQTRTTAHKEQIVKEWKGNETKEPQEVA